VGTTGPLALALVLGLIGCATRAADESEQLEVQRREEAITVRGCSTVADCTSSRNPCTTAQCLRGVCSYTLVGPTPPTACDDYDACTFGDHCVASACQGDPVLTLLTGTALPSVEGWIGYGNASAATSQGGTLVTLDTTPLAGNAYAMHGHTLPTGVYATHDLEWQLSVQSAEHNPADGSAVVFPDYNGWFGASGPNGPLERDQMIWFDDTEIGWGDMSQTAAVNTHVPHVYRLHRTGSGGAELLVDGIVTLSRASLIVTSDNIGFGDQTNDWGVNGRFEISYVRLVPQPQCQ
jgi:hypothetical protein